MSLSKKAFFIWKTILKAVFARHDLQLHHHLPLPVSVESCASHMMIGLAQGGDVIVEKCYS
jgi:hypothetical protein